MYKSTRYLSILLYILLNISSVNAAESIVAFKQEYDWLKLTSDEWIKGDIISMYDEELEFDSKELKLQTIDWDDVAELRSKNKLTVRLVGNNIVEGYVVVKGGQLHIVNNGDVNSYSLSSVLSVTSLSKREIDLWDGNINLGATVRRGNTAQFDYTISAGVQRRSPVGHLKIDYIANYSTYDDQESDEKLVTANSTRLTSIYDWFFSQKIFFRAMDFEYYSDELINIDERISYGVAAGYHIIDNKALSWNVNVGPSYQQTKFITVSVDESKTETSPGLALGTDISYEVTSDIDFDAKYQIKFVNDASGKRVHHFETGFDVELSKNFDLDFTFYFDRTESPHADEDGIIPEQNDFRLVVSLGYDF